jgi:hypothetical protein
MLVSRFNLSKSFNYTPYPFYKKRFQIRDQFFQYMDPVFHIWCRSLYCQQSASRTVGTPPQVPLVSEFESVWRLAGAGRVTGPLNRWQLETQHKTCQQQLLHQGCRSRCGIVAWVAACHGVLQPNTASSGGKSLSSRKQHRYTSNTQGRWSHQSAVACGTTPPASSIVDGTLLLEDG